MASATQPYTDSLNQLRQSRERVQAFGDPIRAHSDSYDINPSLEILHLPWHCCETVTSVDKPPPEPVEGEEWAAVWIDPETGSLMTAPASNAELLALKIISEDMTLKEAAEETGQTVPAIHNLLHSVAFSGIILAPESRIQRSPEQIPESTPRNMREANIFTLQWHITNHCDLNCKHCYDRTDRNALSESKALAVLDDFAEFCMGRNVRGHVSFSGGNPLLRKDFMSLYRRASDLGFETSILGNPANREEMEAINDIQPLDFFQTSLEGLREHNDHIRGKGHFDRVMSFIEIPRNLDISTSIMLTLTRENMDQVIPLAEQLEGRVDCFTFNRLSPVGEGASLAMPSPDDYRRFLTEYLDAAEKLSVLEYKDNLINVALQERGLPSFEGCTGFGCGAAFNFVALLPDGEVHACRKYNTPIGSLRDDSLEAVYSGEKAQRYRKRPSGCTGCSLIASCGGCRAITCGSGLDEDTDVDPYCWYKP